MVPQHPNSFCNGWISRRDCACLTARTKIFSRVEAESSRSADRTSPLPTLVCLREIFCSMSLASVFNYQQLVLLSQSENGIHVSYLAVKMNGNNRSYTPACLAAPQIACGMVPEA